MENPLPNEPIIIKISRMKYPKFLIALVALFFSTMMNAQKIGVVDMDYVLSKMPEFKEAEGRLNAQIETWQSDIRKLQSEYEQKKAAFESEKVLLVGEQLRQRQKEVIDLEENIKNTISLRFGTNGEIDQLRANLTQPFQDQIFEAMKTVAEKNGLVIVFDKNESNVLYLQKRADYTDKVLDLLLGKDKKSNKK